MADHKFFSLSPCPSRTSFPFIVISFFFHKCKLGGQSCCWDEKWAGPGGREMMMMMRLISREHRLLESNLKMQATTRMEQ